MYIAQEGDSSQMNGGWLLGASSLTCGRELIFTAAGARLAGNIKDVLFVMS